MAFCLLGRRGDEVVRCEFNFETQQLSGTIARLRGSIAESFARATVEVDREVVQVELREASSRMPLGRYCRTRPMVVSQVPRTHAW